MASCAAHLMTFS